MSQALRGYLSGNALMCSGPVQTQHSCQDVDPCRCDDNMPPHPTTLPMHLLHMPDTIYLLLLFICFPCSVLLPYPQGSGPTSESDKHQSYKKGPCQKIEE